MLYDFSYITGARRPNRVDTTQLRHKLFLKQRGRCIFCGCQMQKVAFGVRGNLPGNSLTLEHVYSARDIRRIINNKTAASCDTCNRTRNKLEAQTIYKGYPRNYHTVDYFPRLLINILKYKLAP